MKIAVFVSGGGTNLQAIIDNTKDGILKDIEISLVLSSSKTAYALERAADNGIKSAVVSKKDFDSIESWDDAVLAAVFLAAGFAATTFFLGADLGPFPNPLVAISFLLYDLLITSFASASYALAPLEFLS